MLLRKMHSNKVHRWYLYFWYVLSCAALTSAYVNEHTSVRQPAHTIARLARLKMKTHGQIFMHCVNSIDFVWKGLTKWRNGAGIADKLINWATGTPTIQHFIYAAHLAAPDSVALTLSAFLGWEMRELSTEQHGNMSRVVTSHGGRGAAQTR